MRLKELVKYKDGGKAIWGKLSAPERRDYIYNSFLQKGYNPIQAAAIVGNLQQENASFGTSTKNKFSNATGIAQWLGSRKKNLINDYKEWYDIDNQLDFIHREIQGDRNAWTNNVGGKNAFFNATDVETATKIFRKDFERPGEHEANDGKRITNAYSVLGQKYNPNLNYNVMQYNNQLDPNMKSIDWNTEEYQNYLDNIYKYDFSQLPANLQQTVIDNEKLRTEKLNQEIEADKLQKQNMAIEQALQQKAIEREQIIASIPQAEFVGSNLQRSDYNQLLQAPTPTFQQGGNIDGRVKQIMDKAAKENFNQAVQFEKDYLGGKKIRERIQKLGLNPDIEIKRLSEKLNNVKLGIDNTDNNTNGAYYNDNKTEIKYANNSARNVSSETMNHEVGHIFGRSNSKNENFIDNRNALVEDGALSKFLQTLKLTYSDDYRFGEGHELYWEELVADVHSARQSLEKLGYDGRYSNFTNDAYNKMRRFAKDIPDSAAGRLFRKVGTPETSRYQNLKLQMQLQQLDKTGLPKEDQDFLNDYEKNKTKYESIQKKYMFDIMNKIVSNDSINNEKIYALKGGKI